MSNDTTGLIFQGDEDGNIIQARHLGIGTKDSTIISTNNHRLIATIDLEDIVIVDTSEVLLVMNKKEAQKVKKIAVLSSKGGTE